jgi:hypothetical protein
MSWTKYDKYVLSLESQKKKCFEDKPHMFMTEMYENVWRLGSLLQKEMKTLLRLLLKVS